MSGRNNRDEHLHRPYGSHGQPTSSPLASSQSSSSSIQPNPASQNSRSVLHRPSGSIDRSAYAPAASRSNVSLNPFASSSNPFMHSSESVGVLPTYSDAPIPTSPSLSVNNPNFPSNYSAAGYGQRGVKGTGMGFSKFMDDNASVASLLMENDRSWDGAQSDSGHTVSSNHHGGTGHFQAAHMLRTKTSFTHIKNSEHKIPSNQDKFNAYVLPGVAHYDGPEDDDALHDPGPRLHGKGADRRLNDSKAIYGAASLTSWRGWLNMFGLACIILPMIGLFAVYPVTSYFVNLNAANALGLFTNATGQVPDIPNFRGLVDRDTPEEFYTKKGADGLDYQLVFSDEFETDGRTFYEGDDPFFTAMDMHYYATGDVEYYDPQAITTQNGHLVINLTKVPDPSQNHNLSYMSGMLTSWNQLCFTGGIIEASVSLPGTPDVTGYWPAFWTMGNLARTSYGATSYGTWPYSYDSCDTGTMPNQTNAAKGIVPPDTEEGYTLSYMPGQRLSACTCPGEDHPGPSHDVGRGAPELDVFEALVNPSAYYGEVSQTLQMAPFDQDYLWDNVTGKTYTIDETYQTILNPYHGGNIQQSCSALSWTDQTSYYAVDRNAFQTFEVQYHPSKGTDTDGYAYWVQNGTVNWGIKETGLPPRPALDIGQRLMPREPMYMIMNLGMAENFNVIDYDHLKFPAFLRFDYIRIYQRTDDINIGCDPKDFPTADYINRHIEAYTNYNLTDWDSYTDAGFPKSSLVDGC